MAATTSLLTTGGLAVHPLEPGDTNHTIDHLKQQRHNERRIDETWKDIVIQTVVARQAEAGTPIRLTDGRVLTIDHHNGQPTLIATNPHTGQRTTNPDIDWKTQGRVGSPYHDTSIIYDHFRDGQTAVAENGKVKEWADKPKGDQ